MKDTDVRERLRNFIMLELVRDAGLVIADDEPLITGGTIDSLALVQVQLFIEEAFGVRIPDPEMTVATMDTLNQMTARVLRDVGDA